MTLPAWELPLPPFRHRRLVGHIWTTQDGREIAVADLSPSHLLNIIAMLGRKLPGLSQGTPEHQLALAWMAAMLQGAHDLEIDREAIAARLPDVEVDEDEEGNIRYSRRAPPPPLAPAPPAPVALARFRNLETLDDEEEP